MAEVTKIVSDSLIGWYVKFSSMFPGGEGLILSVILMIIFLVVVSLFIWEFYKSLSRRDLIKLNLNQYNQSQHPFVSKILAIMLYFIEYILIIPLLITLWFAALAIVLLLISERQPNEVLLIAGALIGAVRVLAYYKSEIAKDVAKLFPFIMLSVFLLSPGAFNVEASLLKLQEIPSLTGHVFYYLFVIIAIEIVLRILYSIFIFYESEDEKVSED